MVESFVIFVHTIFVVSLEAISMKYLNEIYG